MTRPFPRRLAATFVATTLGLSLLPAAAQAAPAPAAPVGSMTPALQAARKPVVVRVATFNVRTARARGDNRAWVSRVADVSREILSRKPGVVLLQELGPGRADGRKGKINGAVRQTTSLTAKLRTMGGGRYRLVRSYSYFANGTPHGTQGARILYDASRFTLLSRCPETTGKSNYNPSCAFDLPVAAGDSKNQRRSAAYALFRDRRSGRAFWVVSVHLDHRHGSKAKDAKFSRLRVAQAKAVVNRLARLNTTRLPVFFGGDINSWSTDRSRYAPHRYLASRGFRDSVTAPNPVKHLYPTVNHWRTKLKATKKGVRLDVIMVRGAQGFRRWENKAKVTDRSRPSDHNMVVADVAI